MNFELLIVRPLLHVVDIWFYLRHPRHAIMFRRRVGYWPRIGMPHQYHEKMLWRRFIDLNPLFTTFCDKLAVKDWAGKFNPAIPAPKTLWSGTDTDQLRAFSRKSVVFLKSNHACNRNIRLEPGDNISDHTVDKVLEWLDETWGAHNHQWGYWRVPPRLFLEEDVGQEGAPVVDISIHAMSGKPIIIEAIATDDRGARQKGYFHPNGQRWRAIEPTNRRLGRALLPLEWQLPPGWEAARQGAATLSRQLDYARFDFLLSNGQTFQGEITVYPAAGLNRVKIFKVYSEEVTAAWDLRASWFLTTPQAGLWELYRRALLRALNGESRQLAPVTQ